LGANKPKVINRIANIGYRYVWWREIDLSVYRLHSLGTVHYNDIYI